ncbi:macro domain-containing protein [Lysobacter enzymogenes]|uniref:macro domain-containing protein n=1 Tax=Lysobacter enzymogenes TaxID=69 RepID=UPI000895AA20|nr:macro domain-containing protein [Lysobacter enzymogenes]SDW92345.1 O-acetyl-ADP-ribose deacetylase (regulator of RNase III), contains Macro domain [Lysobacter enzymogenes]
MNIIQGDLLQLAADGRFDVIVHGCNCQCRMGRGIALSIRERFPAAWAADQRTVPADRGKLGTYSQAEVEENGHRFVVVNAYTQFHWQGEGVLAEYDAIGRAMRAIAREFHGKRIGYPLIGAGLAKGDWNIIAPIIDEALAGEDHTLVEFTG